MEPNEKWPSAQTSSTDPFTQRTEGTLIDEDRPPLAALPANHEPPGFRLEISKPELRELGATQPRGRSDGDQGGVSNRHRVAVAGARLYERIEFMSRDMAALRTTRCT
jgi:hypothetical protein